MEFEAAAWHDFFIATTGAMAALAGLVFVALSINLRDILKLPGLVSRAAEALVLLLEFVVLGLIVLVPGLATAAAGWAILAVGLIVWAPTTFVRARAIQGPGPATRQQRFQAFLAVELATVPPILAGGSLVNGSGGGFYWLVPGVIFALFAGVLDGWVLLVEILR